MVSFNGKILIIGCGAVAQCTLPLILKHIAIAPQNLIVIDKLDKTYFIHKVLNNNVLFFQEEITHDNFKFILAGHLTAGDICIDLANEIDTHDILVWCLNNNVMYLNTALNVWQHINASLYETYNATKKLVALWPKDSTTAILSHGANPGLISSFVKKALMHIGSTSLKTNTIEPQQVSIVERTLADENFAQLSNVLNIKTIHISEQDSQKSLQEKQKNEFLNTWSIVEFINECIASVEFPWGTHEHSIPLDSSVIDHTIFINSRACNFTIKSWVPTQLIEGMVIPHDETYTLSDYLTIKHDGTTHYKPTVLFVYNPSLNASRSLKELELDNFIPPQNQRIMKEDLISGADKMGCLLMGHNNAAWWTGSVLTLEQTNNIMSKQNATVMQVAAGVLAALIEMVRNPHMGICFPEDLNHEAIMHHALPYLGTFISESTPWKPAHDTTWTFKDFLIHKN